MREFLREKMFLAICVRSFLTKYLCKLRLSAAPPSGGLKTPPNNCTTEAEVLLSFLKTFSLRRDAVAEGMQRFQGKPISPRDVEQQKPTYCPTEVEKTIPICRQPKFVASRSLSRLRIWRATPASSTTYLQRVRRRPLKLRKTSRESIES